MILAAFVLSMPAQLPDVKLNYTTVAVPLSRICEDLSKQVGVRLRVHEDLAAEPVVIRFNDVPVSEGLGKIAEAVRAEWVEGQGESLLIRTQKMQQKLEDEEFQIRVDDIRSAQARRLTRSNAKFGQTEAVALAAEVRALLAIDPERRNHSFSLSIERAKLKTPLQRFQAKLLSSFDPEFLAQFPQHERVVFSTHPTKVQRALELPEDLLNDLAREQELFASALTGQDSNTLDAYGFASKLIPADSQVLVTVQQGYLNCYILDAAYAIFAAESISLGMDAGLEAREAAGALASDKPITLEPLAQELVNRTNATMGDMQPKGQLSPAALDALLNPEKFDPLYSFAELLIKAAERDGVNLVAYAPDSFAVAAAGHMAREPISPDRIFYWLNLDPSVRIENFEGWLTCNARMPLSILESRLPRPSLGRFARRAHQEGFVSIANTADFILPFDDRQTRELGWYYATMLRGDQVATPLENPELVRFYASLSSTQLKAIGEEAPLGLNDLTPLQVDLVESLVFAHSLQPRGPMYSPEEFQKLGETLKNEPTIALANGLPSDTVVDFKLLDQERYVMRAKHGPDQPAQERSVTKQGVATFYAQHTRTDLFPFAKEWEIVDVTPARVLLLDLKIYPTAELQTRRSLEEKRPLGSALSFQQFLEGMTSEERDDWENLLAQANQRFDSRPAGTRQPSQPPPPPPPLSR